MGWMPCHCYPSLLIEHHIYRSGVLNVEQNTTPPIHLLAKIILQCCPDTRVSFRFSQTSKNTHRQTHRLGTQRYGRQPDANLANLLAKHVQLTNEVISVDLIANKIIFTQWMGSFNKLQNELINDIIEMFFLPHLLLCVPRLAWVRRWWHDCRGGGEGVRGRERKTWNRDVEFVLWGLNLSIWLAFYVVFFFFVRCWHHHAFECR